MNRDGLVEVPENALIEERIALGLTAPQLGIVAGAVLFGAALNLLPLWAPLKVMLILLTSGPVALAAVLPIRGEPAYRWLLRALRYWRSPKVWRPAVVTAVTAISSAEAASKPPVSHDVEDSSAVATTGQPPDIRQATESSPAEERGAMDHAPARLRLIRPDQSGPDPDQAALGEDQQQRPPSVPFVLPGPRLVCFLSFVGGVGKTTLAVETASYIAAHARYRTPEGETLGVRVLLIDAARLAAAAGLRLGLDPDGLSQAWTYRDWADPRAALDARVQSRQRVDVITLPPHPQLMGRERPVAEDVGDEFRAPEAEALLNAARGAAYQLVVVDLGGLLEDGHRVLLKEAAVIVGVVRPTLESLPDVLRLTNHLRDVSLGRKLVLVANQCADDTELRRFAREADVPLIGVVPPSPAFVAAADRHEPAWRVDPRLTAALLPIARTVWPLDSLATQPRANGSLAGLLRRALSRAGRHDR